MERLTEFSDTDYKDQTGWLTAFGVFELFAAALIGLTRLHAWTSLHAFGTNPVATYSVALGLGEVVKRIMLGWGSIKARRWARSILIIVSWFNLGIGIVVVPCMFWMMNHLPISDPRLSVHFRMILALIVSAFAFVFTVLIPWVFIRFYSRQDVKLTCEARNPKPSWTDSCPLPVLGLASFLALGAAYLLMAIFLPGFQIPLLAWSLHGVPAKIAMLLWSLGSAYAAYLLYRSSINGFVLAVALTVVGFINGAVFYATKGWDGFMGLVGQNISLQKDLQPIMIVLKPLLGTMMGVGAIAFIVYMVFLKKRYFSNASLS